MRLIIEVIGSYKSFMGDCAKGNILYFDYDTNTFKSKDEVYSNKYEFLKEFLKNFWNEKYSWKEININTKRNVIHMKGELNAKD